MADAEVRVMRLSQHWLLTWQVTSILLMTVPGRTRVFHWRPACRLMRRVMAMLSGRLFQLKAR